MNGNLRRSASLRKPAPPEFKRRTCGILRTRLELMESVSLAFAAGKVLLDLESLEASESKTESFPYKRVALKATDVLTDWSPDPNEQSAARGSLQIKRCISDALDSRSHHDYVDRRVVNCDPVVGCRTAGGIPVVEVR